MTELAVFDISRPGTAVETSTDLKRIAAELAGIGVRFERWEAEADLTPEADDQAVLDAYAADIVRLKATGGYRSVDVVRMWPDHPDRIALREKFLREHTHAEDEVRFFVEGSGLFFIRNGDRVHRLLCERGDLLSVPAGLRHWFDAGERPHLTVIRLFTDPEGWAAEYTGDDVADRFRTDA